MNHWVNLDELHKQGHRRESSQPQQLHPSATLIRHQECIQDSRTLCEVVTGQTQGKIELMIPTMIPPMILQMDLQMALKSPNWKGGY